MSLLSAERLLAGRAVGTAAASERVRETRLVLAPPAVALVMPVANERATIEATWEEIADLDVGPLVWIPVLDSLCRDGTREWLAGLAMQDRRVRPIDRSPARGLAAAYVAGYREALRLGAAKILEIDAGGSHPGAVVPKLVRALDEVDHVATTRHRDGGRSMHVPWRRRALSRAGTWVGRVLLGIRLSDATGGLQGFRREALARLDLDGFLSRHHMVQTELKYRCRHLSHREIPLVYHGSESTLRLASVTDALRVTLRLALDRFRLVRLPKRGAR
jgi:dolichol-phosphate mannosyltransferase